jgi:ATP-dependent RNA helicase DeaD
LALAVAPTRELALQVKRELEWLYELTGASVASCVGGMDMRTERRALERGAHIVVGTPGRLRDHISRRSLDMTGLRAVVLDEADEMLDLGFREDLGFILDAAPADRRTLMFSATVPRSIATLAKNYQRDAVRVSTQAEESQHVDIEYRALTIAPSDRENAIVNVLRYFEAKNALVFCDTRATVNHMTSRFTNRGFSVVALSGELSQNERTHALQAMRDGRARVCVATDVAARGIDLPNLELVIHADVPKSRETLLHRSGRTGRAGRKGVSVLIVPHNGRRRAERLLNNAGIEATWARPPSADDVMRRDDERILADPAFSEPVREDEQTFVSELLARHGAEQVAAALLRMARAGRSAPEELLDSDMPERGPGQKQERGSTQKKERQRDDFTGGVWFSLSVGRKQSAEPRWLLPMLCTAGNLTKRDIGAIRVQQNETFIEIAPASVERFLKAAGPGQMLEKSIRVTQLEGTPDASRESSEKPTYAGKKPYSPRSDAKARPEARERPERKRKFAQKPRDVARETPQEHPRGKSGEGPAERPSEPSRELTRERPAEVKPWEKGSAKPAQPQDKAKAKKAKGKGKKPHKPGFAKSGSKNYAPGKPGSGPLKRKKPKTTV